MSSSVETYTSHDKSCHLMVKTSTSHVMVELKLVTSHDKLCHVKIKTSTSHDKPYHLRVKTSTSHAKSCHVKVKTSTSHNKSLIMLEVKTKHLLKTPKTLSCQSRIINL